MKEGRHEPVRLAWQELHAHSARLQGESRCETVHSVGRSRRQSAAEGEGCGPQA